VYSAINIEHHVERLGAFVTIVLGEMVVNVLYKSANATGLNAYVVHLVVITSILQLDPSESGRALLGLMIAFNLNWIYFEKNFLHFVHALRRHWFTSFLFTTLHIPLCMSLLLASSAMNRLVVSPTPNSEFGGGIKWFFGAGLGVSVCTMTTISVLHKNMDHKIPGNSRMLNVRRVFSRRVVFTTRYMAGIVMILVPLAKNLSSIAYLGIYVGITAFLIIEETLARIERREWELDAAEKKEGVV
jgi:low temperature requirement protein LtrA